MWPEQSLQDKLEGIKYPNNYFYDISTLKPKGDLVKRIEKLKEFAPELFSKTDSFLDVGCSLGYFLFYHAENKSNVVGIDIDERQLELTRAVSKAKNYSNVVIKNTSFRLYGANTQFDLVFLGNIFHYLYRESGWDVVTKLAGLCSKYCIIESPVEGEYFEKNYSSYEMRDYTWSHFVASFSKYFDLVRVGDSHCPGRKIMVFKRKGNTFPKTINVKNIKLDGLQAIEKSNSTGLVKKIYLDKENLVKYKVYNCPKMFLLSAYVVSLFDTSCRFLSHIVNDRNEIIGNCVEYFPGGAMDDNVSLALFEQTMLQSLNCGVFIWDLARVNFSYDAGAVRYYDFDYIDWVEDMKDKKFDFAMVFTRKTLLGSVSPLPKVLRTEEIVDKIIANVFNLEFYKHFKTALSLS